MHPQTFHAPGRDRDRLVVWLGRLRRDDRVAFPEADPHRQQRRALCRAGSARLRRQPAPWRYQAADRPAGIDGSLLMRPEQVQGVRSESVSLSTRAAQPGPVNARPRQSVQPVRSRTRGPGRRPAGPGPRRTTEPGQQRLTSSGQPLEWALRQLRSTSSQRPRCISFERPRQIGSGQPRGETGTTLRPPHSSTGTRNPRRRGTKTGHGNGWLPKFVYREPAYSMCYMEQLARGSSLPLRTPTAARLSPARGRAGGIARVPSSSCADA